MQKMASVDPKLTWNWKNGSPEAMSVWQKHLKTVNEKEIDEIWWSDKANGGQEREEGVGKICLTEMEFIREQKELKKK